MASLEGPDLRASVFGVARRFAWFVPLFAQSVRRGGLSRSARLYSWAAALAYGVAWAASRGEPSGSAWVALRSLGPLSLAGAGVACAAARDLATEDRENGVVDLAESRGASAHLQGLLRLIATIWVVTCTVAVPALILAMATWGSHGTRGTVRLGLALLVYSVAFGIVGGVLSRFSSRLSRRHGRAVFVAFLLAPSFLPGPGASGVVSAFHWSANRVAGLAGLT